ncbi:MAG: hypothetical protein WKG07_04585 [Hymenobacter sp.]
MRPTTQGLLVFGRRCQEFRGVGRYNARRDFQLQVLAYPKMRRPAWPCCHPERPGSAAARRDSATAGAAGNGKACTTWFPDLGPAPAGLGRWRWLRAAATHLHHRDGRHGRPRPARPTSLVACSAHRSAAPGGRGLRGHARGIPALGSPRCRVLGLQASPAQCAPYPQQHGRPTTLPLRACGRAKRWPST